MKRIFTFLMLVCISFAAFAQCEINPDSCALAVKIASFKVEKGAIVLVTAEESNIDYFALETAEGTVIEKQAAKNTPSVYRFTPTKSGIYRVAVVNLDGTIEYTKFVQFNTSSNVQITRSQEGLILTEPQNFIVYDVMGQVLKSGYDTEIALPHSGIVIVKVGNLPPLKYVRL